MYRAKNQKYRHNCRVLFEQGNGHQCIVFDLETTGLNPEEDQIIELAAVRYQIAGNGKDAELQEQDRMDLFMRPKFKVEEKAVKVHHITNEFLANKPHEEDCIDQITEFFGKTPIVIGHNVAFDIKFMENLYKRFGLSFKTTAALDTLNMARDVIDHRTIPNYKLETLCSLYGLEDGITFHSAISDVEATSKLLYALYLEYTDMPDIKLRRMYANRAYWFDGHNKEQRGVHVYTNLGTVWYSTIYKVWLSSEVDLRTVDIDSFEKDVMIMTGITDMDAMGHMTKNRFLEAEKSPGKGGAA